MNGEKTANVLAGTLAGWAIVTVGQPLDYLKTMYQVKTHHLPTLHEIYQDIGLRGFYKGASSLYLFAGICTALEFETFQWSCKKFTDLGLKQGLNPSVMSLMLAGFVTGGVCSTLYTPIEYAKIHSQIQHIPTLGSANRIFSLIKNQKISGIKKLYTGHSITFLKQSTGSAIYYGGYHVAVSRILKQDRDTAKTWCQLLSGGVAGVLYQLYSYPFDTIKTNIQSGKKTFNQMMHGKFWNTSNFRNGLKISLIRSFIVDATNFTVFQKTRHALLKVCHKAFPE